VASIVVVGAGPGLGAGIAARFAREGYGVSLVTREPSTLADVHSKLSSYGVPVSIHPADAGRADDLEDALAAIVRAGGTPDVVVYNAAIVRSDEPGDLSAEELAQTFAVNVSGALVTALATIPHMQERRAGTFLVTGGLPRPSSSHLSLSLGKAGLRARVTMLADYYGPSGVHVAAVTVTGEIRPGTPFDPALIAEEYWRLHRQPPGAWLTERVFAGPS
jgi:NAD(P)-dependent dehydrogenase (short-subunit alcohol dehydrogenase family)